MSQHVDERDADLEALLRATFSSEARNQVPDARAVPPFPSTERVATVHPIRRRWVGLSVVAASLAAVVVGATVIGHEAADSHRAPSTPAGTSVGPAPTTSVPPPSTSPTTSPPTSTSASTPPGVVTKQVTVQGVALTVPTSWNVVAGTADANAGQVPSCLTTDTVDRTTGFAADNCELSVGVGVSPYAAHDPDVPGFTPDGGICGTSGQVADETVTVAADQLTVDGEVAEHRVFTGSCLDWDVQQWTVATTPFVQFTRRTGRTDAAGDATALEVVRSARLPGPRSALRVFDRGRLTAVAGTTVSLNRVVLRQSGGVLDDDPTTSAYPLAADVQIFWETPDTLKELSVDQLRALVAGQPVAGVPAIGTLLAELETDGSEVTTVQLNPLP